MNQETAQSIQKVYGGEVKEDPYNTGKYLVFVTGPYGKLIVFSDVGVMEYDNEACFHNSDNNSVIWLAG